MKTLLFALLLTSSLNAQDTIPYSTLHIYRGREYQGSLIGLELILNNAIIRDLTFGKIKNNSKMIYKLYNEGVNQISVQTELTRAAKINVKFGEEYYIKIGLQYGLLMARPTIQKMSKEQALLDMELIYKVVEPYK